MLKFLIVWAHTEFVKINLYYYLVNKKKVYIFAIVILKTIFLP